MKKSFVQQLTKQGGFTLVELLIYMGLFMIFLLIISGVFISALDIQQSSFDTARIEEDSHFLYARLQYDISRADEVIEPAENGDISNTLALLTDGDVIVYQLIDQKIMISENSSDPRNLTGQGIQVTHLEFYRLGNEGGLPSVRTSLTLQSTTQNTSVPETRELIYTFGTR